MTRAEYYSRCALCAFALISLTTILKIITFAKWCEENLDSKRSMGKLAEIIYHCLKTGELYQYQGKYKVARN